MKNIIAAIVIFILINLIPIVAKLEYENLFGFKATSDAMAVVMIMCGIVSVMAAYFFLEIKPFDNE